MFPSIAADFRGIWRVESAMRHLKASTEFRSVETMRAGIARPGTAIALTLLIILAAVSLAGLLVWQNYQVALAAGETKAQSSADIVAAHMEWMIEASDQALRRIDTALGEGPIGTSPDAVEDISQAVGDLPKGFQYSVYDASGALRLSNVSKAGGVKVDDRDYFKEVKAGAPVAISPRVIERLSKQAVFIIARRIERQGMFRGMATIAIPVKKMGEFWASIGLGPHSTVSIIRTDGWVVARYPDLGQSVNVSKTVLLQSLKKSPKGTYYSAVSPADGLSRIVGYHKIVHWPLIATSGIAMNEALRLFWQSLELQLAFGLPLLILLVGFAIWIAWLLHAYAARNLELEAAVERNHFLFREIHHRVKNNFQAVSSLIRLQPLPEEVRIDMASRISAMVAVHEHIYQSDQFDRVELAPYVERLIAEIARSYPHQVGVDMRLTPITVDRDMVLPLGMVINEVVSNAFKYAFAEDGKGHLVIELTENGGEATLRISDDGPGMDAEGKKGMGSKLIAGFVGQMGGRYRFESGDGVTFTLVFPLLSSEERSAHGALDAA
jgi:two-component sensor histidine kinase